MRIFPRRSLLTVWLPLIIFAPGIPADKQQKQTESTQFLKEVEDRCNIRAAGSAPFRLVARVEAAALESGKQSSVGKMILTWHSPEEWREEITFPNYSEVHVASQGKVWMARSVAFEPLRMYQLHQLIDIRSQWIVHSGGSARVKKGKKQNDAVMRCVEVSGEKEPTRNLCAEAQSLLPLRIDPASSSNPIIPSYEYRDYAPWGGKQFPRILRAYESKHLVVAVQVQELAPNPNADPSLLVQPRQAIMSDWCESAEPAKLTDTYPPHYPEMAKADGQQGFVSIYALIGKDGVPHNLTPVRPARADFDAATIAAISRWRYRPALCGGNPIPFETIIDVNYTLD